MTSIYVGNITYSATERDIEELFSQFGEVASVKLINDRETGRPKGFGFVEMNAEAANKAIESLDGKEFMGRSLKVNQARSRN
ncbi:MAG: RNA-binding protein [Helicobacter sp.]|nr:RNA-binding protein [Helicobacter sp.]MBD5166480.1 RNA-binding protein [Helicobacter sp.]MBD5167789.1 RNA-binding protein [Helicobacter sp.]MDE5816100.1 RNA-binding protein [Helicobacter sp.]MDE6045393.1 RNA-binding protein [Helicobacter sp.]